MAYAKGCLAHGYANGSPYNSAGQRGIIEADFGTAVFVGDPVVMVDAGASTIPATSNSPSESDVFDGTWPIFELASAGAANVIYGFVSAVEPIRNDLSKKHIPASTGGTVMVARAEPDLLFRAGQDGTIAITDINEACDLIAGAGSAATGYSGWTVDISGVAASSQVYIRGYLNTPGLSLTSDDTILLISVQAIQFAIAPVGVGLSA
jgi:hypothetical protein